MNPLPLRIEMRFKNAVLHEAIAAASVPQKYDTRSLRLQKSGPIKAFCDMHRLEKNQVYALLNLKMGPFFKSRSLRAESKKIRPLCTRLSVLA